MRKIAWVLVNCRSARSANRLGTALLEERLIVCFDILPEKKTACFWPPRSGRIETSGGTMLVGVSLPEKYARVARRVRSLHEDETPFIGSLAIDRVNRDYYQWLVHELR